MKQWFGNIWDKHNAGEYICIPTNGVVTRFGNVMGKGVAGDARERYPDLPRIVGDLINSGGNNVYYIDKYHLFTFPTKMWWRRKAQLDIIKRSADQLIELVNTMKIERVYLPRPGCGAGGLTFDTIYESIEHLDDRFYVTVWSNYCG